MRSLILVLAGMLLTPGAVRAQDAHYWTFQFGPRSSLLGGAVIGSVSDVSATFYNPGALALSQDLAFAVSANVFEISGVGLRDGGGEGVNLGTQRSGLRPSLIAGTIGRNLLGTDVLAYSALTRVRGTQDLQGALIASGGTIAPSLGLRDLVASAYYTGEFADTWVGLTYARGIGAGFGVGLTWYGALRSQWRRIESITQTIAPDSAGFSELEFRGGSYSTVRTLAKLGAFFAGGPVTAGVTVTTPSLHLTGGGDLGFDRGLFGTDTTALAAAVESDLAAEYKSPLSIGGGAAVRLGRIRIHGSAEWFEAVSPYVVMEGQDVVAQLPADTFALEAVHAADEVFNWGAGIEHLVSSKLSLFASYATDRSGLTDAVARSGLSILPIDISTVTVGADFGVGALRFTLGAGYGWGRKIDRQLTDLISRSEPNFEATYVYRSMRLIFGFAAGR